VTAALLDAARLLIPFAVGYTAGRTHRVTTTKEFR
jgi:hypothetical protein